MTLLYGFKNLTALWVFAATFRRCGHWQFWKFPHVRS